MHRIARALVPPLIALLTVVVGGAQAAVHSRSAPGFAGNRVTLFRHGQFSGYDALTTKDGTTYVGWISDNNKTTALRQVHLCVLKMSSRGCVRGVQNADALGDSSAAGLRVVRAGGTVELVWIYQPTSGSGTFSGSFGVAQVHGGVLGASSGIPGAPALGNLTSVIARPSGAVSAAVVGSGADFDTAYVYPTLSSTPAPVKAPYPIGNAQIAATRTRTVLTVSHYGSIGDPVRYASKGSGGWSALRVVKKTWTIGNIERLITTRSGIRLVTGTDSATYQPVVARWNGTRFSKPVHTGDRSPCAPASHDLATDASGRLVDVTNECGKMAISNQPRTTHAAIVRVPEGGTQAGGPPQISTAPSGRGWVIWGIESGGLADNLYARRIVLPGLQHTVRDRGAAGKLSLTGPASCLPPITTHVKLKVRAARHWSVRSTKVRLGSHTIGGRLKGASLKPSHRYTLTGTATLRKGGRHARLGVKLAFKTCGRP
jgi:hypothetical protein